jgi:type I restriction enzyme M protein
MLHSYRAIRAGASMETPQLNWIANFIWGLADDVLRDLYVRGKYRDVILPMTVLRRLDAVLEPTKQAVLDMKAALDKAGISNQDAALRQAAGDATNRAFYNTSKFTLRDLRARASQQQLKADFEAYLDGFSPNVQEILDNFEFRNQIPRLSKADALGTLIEKFLDPSINLSPYPVLNTSLPVTSTGSIPTSRASRAAVCSGCASSMRPIGARRTSQCFWLSRQSATSSAAPVTW